MLHDTQNQEVILPVECMSKWSEFTQQPLMADILRSVQSNIPIWNVHSDTYWIDCFGD